jgi:uncharacterized protein
VAFEVPALQGRVNDYANVLTPDQEAELSGLYESVERGIGSQIALLTIASSNGVPLDQYSLTVANTWGLGRSGVDDGLLITLAMNDRAIRIEVGYGLELVIPDEAAAGVIRRMAAEFAAGRRFAGIQARHDFSSPRGPDHLDCFVLRQRPLAARHQRSHASAAARAREPLRQHSR